MNRQANPGSGPRGPVDIEEADELERLRRRAYGPDADIAGDAAAQARLSELEAAQHRQPTPLVDAAWLPASVAEPVPVSERAPVAEPVGGSRSAATSVPHPVDGAFAEQEPAGGSVADSDPVAGAAAAPWWRRRRVAILGGAIAALALIAAIAAGMSQPLADEPTPIPTDTSTAKMPPVPNGFQQGLYLPAPDYVLALESVGDEADAPNDLHGTLNALGISADELRRYEDFEGPDICASGAPCPSSLNVWSGESRFGMTCLFVAVPGQGLREGYSGEGCSPEGFDTIAELHHMGGDSFTRFLLRGDQVNVYVWERAAGPSASQG